MRSSRILKISCALLGTVLVLGFLSACSSLRAVKQSDTLKYCFQQGGQMIIDGETGNGGSYLICVFTDNYQCGLNALHKGLCPKGGLRITGYTTPAARYCVLTGGQYSVQPSLHSLHEQGVCSFDGQRCPVQDYYTGGCELPGL